jgi:hypothetical protein
MVIVFGIGLMKFYMYVFSWPAVEQVLAPNTVYWAHCLEMFDVSATNLYNLLLEMFIVFNSSCGLSFG